MKKILLPYQNRYCVLLVDVEPRFSLIDFFLKTLIMVWMPEPSTKLGTTRIFNENKKSQYRPFLYAGSKTFLTHLSCDESP